MFSMKNRLDLKLHRIIVLKDLCSIDRGKSSKLAQVVGTKFVMFGLAANVSKHF